MRIAMLGIYGGFSRDFNPGNVQVGYYTYLQLKKSIPNSQIDMYCIDFKMDKCKKIEQLTPFEKPFSEFKMNFFFLLTEKSYLISYWNMIWL
ncbi:MAG: hypothetical protein ACYCYE_15800 [Clostridia bacterium]